jgi:plastocyanin
MIDSVTKNQLMKRKHVFYGALSLILASCLLMMACSKSNGYGSSSSNNPPTIYMKGSVFSNTNLRINQGTMVLWKNDDSTVHTVTSDQNAFDSGDIQPGGSFSFTFNSMGTFAYHDKHHLSMTGVVVVGGTTQY